MLAMTSLDGRKGERPLVARPSKGTDERRLHTLTSRRYSRDDRAVLAAKNSLRGEKQEATTLTVAFDLPFLERDLNQPFLSASRPPWLSLVSVLLDSRKDSSSRVSVPVDLESLVGLGGLGLPLGVDKRLRWL